MEEEDSDKEEKGEEKISLSIKGFVSNGSVDFMSDLYAGSVGYNLHGPTVPRG